MAAMMQSAFEITYKDKGFAENVSEADFFVPVPLHKSRERERGFNQSELLAHALSKIYGVKTINALRRDVKTRPMYGLMRTERYENVSGVFSVKNPGDIEGADIILIDDIYTTGATLEECARTLVRAGAANISAMTFAITGGN